MSTADDLKAEFGTRYPTLEEVGVKLYGLEQKRMRELYHKRLLPFPACQPLKSKATKILVDVEDLGKHLDEQFLIAREQM